MNFLDINNPDIVERPEALYATKRITRPNGIFIKKFVEWSWLVLIPVGILQCIIFWSVENAFAVSCALIGWRLTEKFLLQSDKLKRYALSSFLIIGYAVTQYCLPLIFTLLEGKPIIYNLNLVYDVFIHSILALITLLAAHSIYINARIISTSLRAKIQSIFQRNFFFKTPSDSQIWLIGLIGLVAMFYIYFAVKVGDSESVNSSGNKFVDGLKSFVYAPYFILIKKLYSREYKINKQLIVKLLLYTILLFVVSIARNSRASFMIGFTALGLGYFLGLLFDKFSYKIFNLKTITLALVALWIVTGPLSDLGVAMVIVRGERRDISKQELITRTLQTYQDKEAIRLHRLISSENISDWNEKYFDNIFLSRFCNLKFNDISLEQANKIGEVDPAMREFSINQFWNAFPAPVLSFLQIDIDKRTVVSVSFGDYLFYRAGSGGLGGFKTGQFAGTGMAAFGWWYLLIMGLGFIPVYFLLDLFVLYRKDMQTKEANVYISLAGLLSLKAIFMFLASTSTSESVMNIYNYIVRGWPQTAFLYWAIFQFTFFILKFTRR